MKQLGKWMLGAAVAAGTLSLGAATANAQVGVGLYVGGGAEGYVPPSPGLGYQWVAGYYSGGYWVPGRWAYVGARYYDRDDYRYRAYDRDHDGERWRDGNRDRDRNWVGDRDRGRDRDGYRDRR